MGTYMKNVPEINIKFSSFVEHFSSFVLDRYQFWSFPRTIICYHIQSFQVWVCKQPEVGFLSIFTRDLPKLGTCSQSLWSKHNHVDENQPWFDQSIVFVRFDGPWFYHEALFQTLRPFLYFLSRISSKNPWYLVQKIKWNLAWK